MILYPGLALDPSIDDQPRSSPDGTKIVFVSTRDLGGGGQIYVLNSEDGVGWTNISNGSADDIPSEWGPIGLPPPRPKKNCSAVIAIPRTW